MNPKPASMFAFSRPSSRARGLTQELRTWCRCESQRDKDIVVGEVGLDLIAGQKRLVVQSLFDLLSDREL